jgi:hypothetical protein
MQKNEFIKSHGLGNDYIVLKSSFLCGCHVASLGYV